ncbi:RAMP superfamily CRISPR-associated protein [Azonexus sp.]|uniref:RAMP superfamily CRISPR-associated protein n=1 Tax=Azonexus sp. TaxID=1872668 RepID=UPI0039E55788
MPTMIKNELRIELLTPAFLGDAEQKGVWRTPPLKALLREWWRIVAAPEAGYRHQALREQEGVLFGNAWLDSGATQSKLRLALAHWHEGKSGWEGRDPSLTHPEVKNRNTGQAQPVGSQLYLGYGPLVYERGAGTALKNNAALQAGDSNVLKLAWSEQETAIPHVLQLIHWFGTIGGRSRNGWGSLEFVGQKTLVKNDEALHTVLRPLADCLQRDWPHAIGQDKQGALIWESKKTFNTWQEAMRFLAQTKIGFRTQENIRFKKGVPHPNERKRNQDWQLHHQPEERHLLAYPVTHHEVQKQRARGDEQTDWGDGRLANQLRFKLFRDSQQQLRARIYHTPHACPLPGVTLDQQAVWQKIHAWLDHNTELQRLGGAQ